MRPHREIIKAAGAEAVHGALGGRVSIHTVRSWVQRNGIPAEHWVDLVAAEIATLEELAHGAARVARPAPA